MKIIVGILAGLGLAWMFVDAIKKDRRRDQDDDNDDFWNDTDNHWI